MERIIEGTLVEIALVTLRTFTYWMFKVQDAEGVIHEFRHEGDFPGVRPVKGAKVIVRIDDEDELIDIRYA